MHRRLISRLILLMALSTATIALKSQTYNIGGEILSSPLGYGAAATLTARSLDGELIGSAITIAKWIPGHYSGMYDLNITMTSIDLPSALTVNKNPYPNPFSHSTKTELALPVEGQYTTSVTDISGRTIGKMVQQLTPGNYIIETGGLGAGGVKILTVTGPVSRFSTIIMQQLSASPPFISITPAGDGIISKKEENSKSGNDTFRLIVEADGHYPLDTILEAKNQSFHHSLKQIPDITHTATVTGLVLDTEGNPVEGATITVRSRTQVYKETTTNSQGEFNTAVNYHEYINPNNSSHRVIIPDSLLVEVNKEWFHPNSSSARKTDQAVNFGTINIKSSLPSTFNLRITPYTATNISMPELTTVPFTLYIRTTSDNLIHTFTQSGDNPIDITLDGYNDREIIKLWHNGHNNATMSLADFMVIEYKELDWRAPNVAQNRPTRRWAHGQPFDTLTTVLENLVNPLFKDKLELYMPEYLFETHGGTVTFNGDTVMYMLARARTLDYVLKNWKGSHVPYVERMIFDYELVSSDPWNNTKKLSQEDLDEMITVAENVDRCAISATGRIRMPVVYTIVSGQEDPAVQSAIARGWEYTSMSWRERMIPGNSSLLEKGTRRIIRGSAHFTFVGPSDIYEEEVEKTICSTNGPGNIASKTYIVDLSTKQLNKLGKTMVSVSTSANTNTEILPPNQ